MRFDDEEQIHERIKEDTDRLYEESIAREENDFEEGVFEDLEEEDVDEIDQLLDTYYSREE